MSVEKAIEIVQNINTLLKENISLIEKGILKDKVKDLYEIINQLDTSKLSTPRFEDKKRIEHVHAKIDHTQIEKPIEQPVETEPLVQATKQTFPSTLVTPNRSIRDFIDLNKSFIFINELFNGNNAQYNVFVDTLNQYPTEEECMDCLSKKAAENNWDVEEHVYQLFCRVVEKRFNA